MSDSVDLWEILTNGYDAVVNGVELTEFLIADPQLWVPSMLVGGMVLGYTFRRFISEDGMVVIFGLTGGALGGFFLSFSYWKWKNASKEDPLDDIPDGKKYNGKDNIWRLITKAIPI